MPWRRLDTEPSHPEETQTMIKDPTPAQNGLARLLAAAQHSAMPLANLAVELIPLDLAAAFAVQHQFLAWREQAIAGWKVGAKSPTGPILGAPLPAVGVFSGEAQVRRADFNLLGIELEIAFRFSHVFEPRATPYSDAEVQDAVSSMQATIEVVTSRYAQWPAVDKLAQLADLQNHGALACGEAIPYRADFDFEAPQLSFAFNGVDIVKSAVANPAGDPRRLLSWVVNHCSARGIAIGSETVITTGSYTGMHFPVGLGSAVGEIRGLPPVCLTIV
jgi:2-keto-4-pentenoate hydratase